MISYREINLLKTALKAAEARKANGKLDVLRMRRHATSIGTFIAKYFQEILQTH